MTSPLLTAQGLGLKIEDRWLIKDLDLALKPGSFVAITGSSGSGKTTLLRTLAGDIGAAEGTINNQLECPTRLAMIFQDLQLAEGSHCSYQCSRRLTWAPFLPCHPLALSLIHISEPTRPY